MSSIISLPYLDAPSFILGVFNTCNLNRVLPNFKQYVTRPTYGEQIVDLCYGNIKGAFQSRPFPGPGRSDHNTVQLTPVYKSKRKRSKPTIRSVNTWSKDATETLNGCFKCTEWSVFLEDGSSLDDSTDVIQLHQLLHRHVS